MDNLFDILIYGFIIVSFISSFFKKKKSLPKKSADQIQQQLTEKPINTEIQSQVPIQPKPQEYDILKEIEGFFNVGQPKQSKTQVHTDKKMYEGAEQRENFIPVPEKSFHANTSSEHTFTDPWDLKRKELEKKKKKLSPEIEKQASAYEESLIKRDSTATRIIKDINDRLNKPSTLKEYVIISEIIGKPKALKR